MTQLPAPGMTYDGKPIKMPAAWSYSALSLFEECPFRYYQTKVLKFPDPPGPALLKGRKVHEEAEKFLKSPSAPLPKSFEKFDGLMHQLRALNPYVEQQITFTSSWQVGRTGWLGKDVWLRAAWDAAVLYEDKHLDLIDHKTGKRYDSNDDQLELFALTGMLKLKAKTVETRLWYVESGLEVTAQFDAKDAPALMSKWTAKAQKLFTETTWAPKPSDRCRFCPVAKSAGGPCRYG